MTPDLDRLRETERWIAWVRLAAVPFAIVEVGLLSTDYPPGYEGWAWATTGLLAVAGVGFFLLSRWEGFASAPRLIGLLGLTVDTVIVSAFVLIYQYEIGSPVNELFFVLLVEAAVRYGIRGGLLMPLAIAPLLALAEWWRESRFDNPPHGYQADHIVFPWGLLTLTGMIVGWLVDRLRHKTTTSEAQVVQAELLRGAAVRTSSRRRHAAHAPSALRSISTRLSRRSSASCAASSRSTGWRSSSKRREPRKCWRWRESARRWSSPAARASPWARRCSTRSFALAKRSTART